MTDFRAGSAILLRLQPPVSSSILRSNSFSLSYSCDYSSVAPVVCTGRRILFSYSLILFVYNSLCIALPILPLKISKFLRVIVYIYSLICTFMFGSLVNGPIEIIFLSIFGTIWMYPNFPCFLSLQFGLFHVLLWWTVHWIFFMGFQLCQFHLSSC